MTPDGGPMRDGGPPQHGGPRSGGPPPFGSLQPPPQGGLPPGPAGDARPAAGRSGAFGPLGGGPSSWFRVVLLAASAAVLIAIALASARVGPWVDRPQGTGELPTFSYRPTLPSVDVTPPTLPTPNVNSSGSPFDPTALLYVLGGVLVLALLAMAYAWWRERGRRPSPVDRPRRSPAPAAEPEPPPTDLPFDARATADYVIACWQLVESAAAAAGVPRRSQHTPTEFLATVGLVHPLDDAAVSELLQLYYHARFDHVALGSESAQRARIAADAICSRLPAITPEYRR